MQRTEAIKRYDPRKPLKRDSDVIVERVGELSVKYDIPMRTIAREALKVSENTWYKWVNGGSMTKSSFITCAIKLTNWDIKKSQSPTGYL